MSHLLVKAPQQLFSSLLPSRCIHLETCIGYYIYVEPRDFRSGDVSLSPYRLSIGVAMARSRAFMVDDDFSWPCRFSVTSFLHRRCRCWRRRRHHWRRSVIYICTYVLPFSHSRFSLPLAWIVLDVTWRNQMTLISWYWYSLREK